VWAIVALAIGISGALDHAPLLAPFYMIGSVVTAIALYRYAPFRQWANELSLARLIALHAIRLPIGCVFLWQYAHDRLPGTFAIRGGIGDIAIGMLALFTLAAGVQRTWLVRLFSILGLVDIIVVAATGMYLFVRVREPLMTAAVPTMPYALLPLVIVPIVITTHLLVLARTRRGDAG
jgi:hypothetical protein